ncbi:MAG: bifunctional folylpolyglutamate synthase/dihydrofolate synthase [Deltaproteobacteria bacterium]|nr:bifunctional folylpolyglutamate synthase/dihydrofolate synthase [Deltaproteobacteria bacterium]
MLSYPRALAALFARQSLGIRMELGAVQAALAALGSPQVKLPHVVVVGGTNGKGSTAALVAATAQRAGHRVGLYTSPHLLRFVERICVQGVPVREGSLAELYAEVAAVEKAAARPLTFFECATVMAVLAFVRSQVDVGVLEVGLGGRLDATNAVPHQLAVLTPIDLDHTAILGDTVAAIAAEKAAIIPQRGVVVSAPQSEAASRVIAEVARTRSARLVMPVPAERRDEALVLDCGGERVRFLASVPAYQIANLATAAAACAELANLGLACPPGAFAGAAAQFAWPGRYQWLDADLLVDGAHNPAGMRALCDALAEDPRAARPLHAVFSALGDKDAAGMLAWLTPRAATLTLCPLRSRRSRSAQALRDLSKDAHLAAGAADALAYARTRAALDNGFVLVCGSLYLVGEVLALVTGASADPPVDG